MHSIPIPRGVWPRILLFAWVLAISPTSTPPCLVAFAQNTSKVPLHQPSSVVLEGYPRLIDITASTGIRFEHNSSPEQKYIVESMGGGVALIDYDGDGWQDIYFTNSPSVAMSLRGEKARSALYRNNHDGTFTDVSEKAGVAYPCWAMGAAVGDYNNDGLPDLLVTCINGIVLYSNNGNGTFSNRTIAAGLSSDHLWATGASFGDYDGDGWADLFVAHYVDVHLDRMAAFGSSATCRYLGIDVQCGPRGLKGSPDSLYHNNHDGTFSEVSAKAGVNDADQRFGLGVLWSDFNNDGKLDLFVANDSQPNYLYQGNGAGKFTEIGMNAGVSLSDDGNEQANMGVAAGDYLHSGLMSLFVSHFDNEYATLYRNDGAMNFTDVSMPSGVEKATRGNVGWGDTFVDFDNDGWLDLFLVNGHVYPQVESMHQNIHYLEPKILLINDHAGKFRSLIGQAPDAIQIPQVSRGLAIGDLFNDGRIEAVVENLVGGPMILQPENNSPSHQNHWISFQLTGVSSNRLALNARVTVTAGELKQLGEVNSGGSYLSQNDLRLHFGLGNHTQIDTVTIRWPNGKLEVLKGLEADRFYTITEGAGLSNSRPPGVQKPPT